MAKKIIKPDAPEMQPNKDAFPTFDELSELMVNETTSILNDYQRQWIGAIGTQGKPGDSIFINFDPVLMKETYLQWAQYDLYWYLEKDPQVGAILDSAKVNVSGMPWDVKPFLRKGEKKPSTTSQDQADFIKDMFESMETFPQHLFDLMDSIGKGFSFSEIVWERKDIWWNINRLMNRPQRRIQFDAQTRQPKIRTMAQPYFGEKIEPGKYIVHRCSSNWENSFGDALDASLYWMWLFKKIIVRFWMQHLEVGASSVPVIKIPPDSGKKLKNEAIDIAKMIRNGAFGYIPSNFEITYAEAKNALQDTESYEKFIRMMDEQMDKRVKGQVLTTEGSSAGGHGSKGMGQTHKITEDQFDIFRAKGLAASVNKYLVKYAMDYNFATIEGYPRFAFAVEEEEDMKAASEVLVNVTKALGTPTPEYDIDIEQINEKFGYTFTKKEKKEPIQQPFNPTPFQQQPLNPDGTPKEFAHGTVETETYKSHPSTRADEKVYQEQIGTIGDYEIWRVDGEYIRDNVNVDYVEGGNPGRYGFVPEGEIWLESEFSLVDLYATMIHEFVEVSHMVEDVWTYDKAHDKANEFETQFRQLVKDGKVDATFKSAMSFLKINFNNDL